MKKLLSILFLLFLSVTMFAQQLSYRFANPRIIRLSNVDRLQFDVQVRCDQAGTYMWGATVKFNFNNTTFNNTATTWLITGVGAFSGNNSAGSTKYNATRTISGTSPNKVYNIIFAAHSDVLPNAPNSNDFALIPTDWTTMFTVKASLAVFTGDAVAGLDFLESGMNGAVTQQYITAPLTIANYNSTNLYDTRDFLNDFTGRFYSTLYGWSSLGSVTDEVQVNNWTTNLSTTVWEGSPAIDQTDNTTAFAKNVLVKNGAVLSIPALKQLTVSGNTAVVAGSSISIQSTATGTGSLITEAASGTGYALVQRWMSAGKWNIVSSPLSGQTVTDFLTNNLGIATKSGTLERGILEYLPSSNAWSTPSTSGPAGYLGGGKGFSLRLQGTTPVTNDAAVTFSGALQTGAQSTTASAGYWNSVGNPYTSAIRLTSNTAQPNFLTENGANIVSGSGIYVWEAPDVSNGQTGKYTTYSNAVGGGDFQQGQAFMVNVTATSLSFTSAMQIHNNGLALKSTGSVWPTIKLKADVGEQKSSTIVAFNSGMTKGLDQTFDASLLKGATDLIVYTKLVEDNGIPFAIQALPANDYSSMIIPVGLDFKSGGEVVFSAELLSMPTDSKVIFEDKLLKTFTDLSKSDYTVSIAANSSISDRFKIHTSYQTTGTPNDLLYDKLSAYAFRNIEIRLKGAVSSGAVATLYDIQGRTILVKILEGSNLNIIPTPNIKTGIYMLSVNDHGKVSGFKIPVTE